MQHSLKVPISRRAAVGMRMTVMMMRRSRRRTMRRVMVMKMVMLMIR